MKTKKAEPESVAVEKVSQAVQRIEPPAERMIMMIMDAARDKSIDIDKLERLIALQERMSVDQRKVAYTAAMARLQAKLPQINEAGRIEVKGQLRSKYALIEDIDTAIRPLLAEEGFSFSCDQQDSPEANIRKFVGKMSHCEGHEETKSIRLPYDKNEGRSAVQSEKSTYSYAARVLLTMHLNLVTRDVDTDGQAVEFLSPAQVAEIRGLIKETGSDEAKFLELIAGVGKIEDISARDFKRVMNALETKKRTKPSSGAAANARSEPAASPAASGAGPEAPRPDTKVEKSETQPANSATQPPVVETRPGVFEPDPALVAKKWFIRIETAPTVAQLKEIGALIVDARLSEADLDLARKLFASRLAFLTRPAADQPPAETAIPPAAADHSNEVCTEAQFDELSEIRMDRDIRPAVWIAWARSTFGLKKVADLKQHDFARAKAWCEAGGGE